MTPGAYAGIAPDLPAPDFGRWTADRANALGRDPDLCAASEAQPPAEILSARTRVDHRPARLSSASVTDARGI